ncbi:unnamed protein product [Prorocentrum cordatum]|uniref:PPM-type phosphatase domain-containing protein n=1 Tax=Prorocentrum cordatum TaxID=2364126 RepID=A0ABN9SWJ8_9DINO|nr:unnamed protein product [Polarella glacialis]
MRRRASTACSWRTSGTRGRCCAAPRTGAGSWGRSGYRRTRSPTERTRSSGCRPRVARSGSRGIFLPEPVRFGGRLIPRWGLAVSRSFGDLLLKEPENYGCSKVTPGGLVSADPELHVVDVDPATDRFLVLACDGIWDVLRDEDAVAVCAGQAGAELAAHSLVPGSACPARSGDNLTALVVSWRDAECAFGGQAPSGGAPRRCAAAAAAARCALPLPLGAAGWGARGGSAARPGAEPPSQSPEPRGLPPCGPHIRSAHIAHIANPERSFDLIRSGPIPVLRCVCVVVWPPALRCERPPVAAGARSALVRLSGPFARPAADASGERPLQAALLVAALLGPCLAGASRLKSASGAGEGCKAQAEFDIMMCTSHMCTDCKLDWCMTACQKLQEDYPACKCEHWDADTYSGQSEHAGKGTLGDTGDYSKPIA